MNLPVALMAFLMAVWVLYDANIASEPRLDPIQGVYVPMFALMFMLLATEKKTIPVASYA
jgi:hypothetical protein